MQPKNQNGSVQLSTRYQQYDFAKRHLRGTSRPEVFPIGENTGETTRTPKRKRITTGRTRNFGSSGQLHAPDEICSTLTTSMGTGGNNVPNILGAKIRRLTPTECERLQGFPEIEKYDIIEICKDNQKKNVGVETQNHKLQKSVGSVEKKDSKENAGYVVRFLNTRNQQIDKLVHPSVLINCEESGVEIHSQEKLLLNARYAEKKNWCHQHIKIEDFVQMLVGINTIKEKIISLGEADCLRNEQYLILQKSGKKLERLFGKEIMQPVGDVEKDLIILKELLKFTTLNHLNTENLEQKLTTLSLFVIRAIIGYIPKEILNQDTFTIGIKTKVGWTEGVSDTQRYKCLGNAVTTNVIKAIIEKLNAI